MNLPFLRGRNFAFKLRLKNGEEAPCEVKEMRLTLLRKARAVEIDCYVERPDFWAELERVGLAALRVRVSVYDGTTYDDEIRAGEDASAVLVVADRLDPALVKIRVAESESA